MKPGASSLHLLAAAAAVVLGMTTGCQGEIGAAPIFIALDSDFAPFKSWTRVSLGDELLAGHRRRRDGRHRATSTRPLADVGTGAAVPSRPAAS